MDLDAMYKASRLPDVPDSVPREAARAFKAQNICRYYKRLTIELLEDYKKFFNQKYYTGRGTRQLRQEGVMAVNEAIDALKKFNQDLKPLFWNKHCYKAARIHSVDVEKNGNLKHIGSDGSSASDRLKRVGNPFYGGAENMSIGKDNPFESVLSMYIDDGVKSRGHRNNLLCPAHRCGRVAMAKHPKRGTVYTFTYAFYVSRPGKGKAIQKFIEAWREQDENEAKENGWKGNGCLHSKITFEFPYLVKEIDWETDSVRLAKDLNAIIYKD